YHGMTDRVVDWHPPGDKILFASGRESEKERFNQLYTISSTGGTIEKLPFAYGEFASYSPDASQMAIVFRSEVFRTWKRYRGGDAADIYLYNLQDHSSQNISEMINAGEELPMWSGNSIYFLSDNGPEQRMNLWQYDVSSKTRKQVTNFTDYDVHFPSLGPSEIVFEAGGKLYLYQLANGQLREVQVNLISDKATLKPSIETVEKYVQWLSMGRDGNRALIQARGDIFSLPAENGFVKNLTQSPGSAERYPAWSPDGKSIAYWSDQSGEYELRIMDAEKNSALRKITNYGPGFRYSLSWSPDSKKIAFIDKAMRIRILEIATGITTDVDKGLRMTHGALQSFTARWSPDSRWLTYTRDLDNLHNAVFVYDYRYNKLTQVTSGYYDCYSPVFDSEGKYIYTFTNQNFSPSYSDIDNTFIYANSTQLAAISLKKDTPSLIAPKNDSVSIKKDDDTASDKQASKKSDKKSKDSKEAKPSVTPVEIDFTNIEARLIILPLKAGNYSTLNSASGKIIYVSHPRTGDTSSKSAIKYYDIEKREEKVILDDANRYELSADGKKILASRSNTWAIVKAEENQKFEKPLRLAEMEMVVDPAREWRQIFMDAWRFERDYF